MMKRSRLRAPVLILCAALAIVVPFIGWQYIGKRDLSRKIAIGEYARALNDFYLQTRRWPSSLAELEQSYNASKERRMELPPPPWFLHPEFRPIPTDRKGRFLAILECKPASLWNLPTRSVIFVDTHRNVAAFETDSNEELDKLIAEDDKRRGK